MVVLGEGHQCSHRTQDPYDTLDADTLHQRTNRIVYGKQGRLCFVYVVWLKRRSGRSCVLRRSS